MMQLSKLNNKPMKLEAKHNLVKKLGGGGGGCMLSKKFVTSHRIMIES